MKRRLFAALTVVLATLASVTAPASAHDSYEVRSGDTLSHIAVRFGVSVSDIVADNDLGSADQIRVGQKLRIPHGGTTTTQASATTTQAETPAPAATTPTSNGSTYTVASGDTLSGIALKLRVRQAELTSLNGITNPNRIRIGQKLQVPAGAVVTTNGAGGDPTPSTDNVAAHLARYPRMPQRITSRPERAALIPIFERWAAANNLPVDLVMGVAWQESGWNNEAVSYAGAVGVGQIMPATGEWVATDLIGQPGLRRENPEDNIRMSARYLRWLINFMGSEDLALAGYFQGPNSVKAGQMLGATERYVASVNAHRGFFVAG